MTVLRVDLTERSEYYDETAKRGLGRIVCSNPECESHKYDDERSPPAMSPGRALVHHVHEHMRLDGKWTVRHAGYLKRALRLAIDSGMEFCPWDGQFLAFGEGSYTLACNTGPLHLRQRRPANTSAARAMENQWGRPPFMLRGKRVCVGSTFWWAAAASNVTVTSIRSKPAKGEGKAKTVHYLVCAKRERVEGSKWHETKNVAYYKITPAQLRAAARAGTARWA
jgi:hypothetical protein